MSTTPRHAAATSTVLRGIGARFDHVAHAVPSIRAALPLYQDLLGGVAMAGGINPWGGHVAVQFVYAGGDKVELLEPIRPDSPSVGNFLAANPRGGLHHVTFRVPDLTAALDALAEAGFQAIGTRRDSPMWQETYLHPRQTGGVLIQLAQAPDGMPGPLRGSLEDLLAEADAERARAAGENR